MSSSQHQVIDLTEKGSVFNRYKRKMSYHERIQKKESEKAIDLLLGSRLKSMKTESKPDVKSESGYEMQSNSIRYVQEALASLPEIEWWDEPFQESADSINHLVEHPVPLKGTTALAKQATVVKAMLTPAERDKLRRLKKKEKVQDMQDKIKMGLIKPPPPKIKMKNLMLVLGKEAVAGPSAVEQMVKAQVEERFREHERRNEERKLSPEERREKNIAKWTRPLEKATVLTISVFVIFGRINNKVKFKISKNAEQLHLGGVFLNSKLRKSDSSEFHPSMVVVEGSRKAVKRFDRLLLHRIDWHEKLGKEEDDKDEKMESDEQEESDDDDEEENGQKLIGGGGVCVRIFHGSESKKKFSRWCYNEMRELGPSMALLEDIGCTHFWDMVSRHRSNQLDV